MKEGQNDEGNSVQGAYSYFVRLLLIGSTKRERRRTRELVVLLFPENENECISNKDKMLPSPRTP